MCVKCKRKFRLPIKFKVIIKKKNEGARTEINLKKKKKKKQSMLFKRHIKIQFDP